MNIPGGFFVTFEGIEGCGKSTQAGLLADYLKAKGLEVVLTHEPGGTAIGSRIRAILLDPEIRGITGLTELMLFSADRAQHMAEVIEPALKEGGVVICDRFSDATEAYQGYARGLDLEVISRLSGTATGGRRPNLTLLLDLPVETGLRRAIRRNKVGNAGAEARFEDEAARFHEKVRRGYLEIARREPVRVRVIDASGTVEKVHLAIKAAVDAAMAGTGG